MRISRRRPRYFKQTIKIKYRINGFIKSPQVRLIDETDKNVGVIDTSRAISMAREKGLDLVEVSPLANPPVAKILDFNKLKYQEDKEQRKEKARQKKVEVKGIRLSLRIGDHDLEVKVNQAQKFLTDNDKVKIELFLRGREREHQALAREIVNKFMDQLGKLVPLRIDQELDAQRERLTIIVAKKS